MGLTEETRREAEGALGGEKVEGLWRGRNALESVERQRKGGRKEGRKVYGGNIDLNWIILNLMECSKKNVQYVTGHPWWLR